MYGYYDDEKPMDEKKQAEHFKNQDLMIDKGRKIMHVMYISMAVTQFVAFISIIAIFAFSLGISPFVMTVLPLICIYQMYKGSKKCRYLQLLLSAMFIIISLIFVIGITPSTLPYDATEIAGTIIFSLLFIVSLSFLILATKVECVKAYFEDNENDN